MTDYEAYDKIFAKSMHYNPFAYISKKNREKDILKFVEVLIKNTSSSQQPSGDDFWVKAEKLLYTAYIALIFAMYPEDQWNFETLIDMINNSECREDDEEFKNCIDIEFEIVECWLNGTTHEDPEVMADYGDIFETKPDAEQRRLGAFALKQFKAYKLAAGKTAKSILISCSTRLAPFAIDEVLEITSYDELHLDRLGDELSALFIIISDTDATFNFLVAIMYSQLFNLLCMVMSTPQFELSDRIHELEKQIPAIEEYRKYKVYYKNYTSLEGKAKKKYGENCRYELDQYHECRKKLKELFPDGIIPKIKDLQDELKKAREDYAKMSAERKAIKKEADRLSRLAQQKRDSQRTLARYMQNEQAAKRKKSQLE
ncbi:TraG family protein [Ruminococcus albus 8]|uniref:TraG family protein n=1 Tax=Ruminococcus albus 8 TaxID=246199 RepID=E9SEF8_RUMAL|nr:TraG family protein [Ruminococcus albus 8]